MSRHFLFCEQNRNRPITCSCSQWMILEVYMKDRLDNREEHEQVLKWHKQIPFNTNAQELSFTSMTWQEYPWDSIHVRQYMLPPFQDFTCLRLLGVEFICLLIMLSTQLVLIHKQTCVICFFMSMEILILITDDFYIPATDFTVKIWSAVRMSGNSDYSKHDCSILHMVFLLKFTDFMHCFSPQRKVE